MIEPLQDSYFAWLMKYRMLKPAYMAVLKGRVCAPGCGNTA
jgi:sulfide:quinone oxidoreductase